MDASSRAVGFLENEHRLRNSMQTFIPREPDLLHARMSSSAVYQYILRSGEMIPLSPRFWHGGLAKIAYR